MKHLINLIREWYSHHLYVIDLEKNLAMWPDSEQNQGDHAFYSYLEESTAKQIEQYVSGFFLRPFMWPVSLFKPKPIDTDELPF